MLAVDHDSYRDLFPNDNDLSHAIRRRTKYVVDLCGEEFLRSKQAKRLRRLLLTLSQRYPDALRLDLSRLGGRTTDALIVRPEHLQPAAKPSVEQLQGELVHIHETERSMHILLSPGDARAVIGAKWGQFCVLDSMPRNLVRVPVGLEGSRAEVEQIWVYAPRTREEVELIERMCEASVRWAATTQVEADKQKRKK